MAVYLKNPDLTNESLKGFEDCVDGKALNKKGRKTALAILENIDYVENLGTNILFKKITKSLQ